MANREQRRNNKKLLNKPELKDYVDRFCKDVSSMIMDNFEEARKEADNKGTKLNFAKIQEQLEVTMKDKGEELGNKVKDIARKHQQPTRQSAPIRQPIRQSPAIVWTLNDL